MSKVEHNQEFSEEKNEQNTEENVEEEEQLDEETTSKLRNLTVDDHIFSNADKSNQAGAQQSSKGKEKKGKKNKRGQDFLEYAKTNGIEYQIKYEEIEQGYQRNDKGGFNKNKDFKGRGNNNFNNNAGNNFNNYKQRENQQANFTNNVSNVDNVSNVSNVSNVNTNQITPITNTNDGEENSGQQQRQFQNRPNQYKKNFNQNKKMFYNNNNNNNNNNNVNNPSQTNQNVSAGNKFITNSNKFDNINAQAQFQQMGVNPYEMQSQQTYFLYQQQMMDAYRHQMMQQQQSNVQSMPNVQFANNSTDNSDESIMEILDYYFSERNLNKDFYLRSRLDSDGFILANNLLNFNKLKAKEVGLDRLEELFRISPSQVIEVARSDTGMLMLRNKDWEEFKERLTPIEMLQQQNYQRKLNRKPYGNNQMQMQWQMQQGNVNSNYFYHPMGGMEMYQMGQQMGQMGQVNPMGQMGQVNPMGQMGQVNPMSNFPLQQVNPNFSNQQFPMQQMNMIRTGTLNMNVYKNHEDKEDN